MEKINLPSKWDYPMPGILQSWNTLGLNLDHGHGIGCDDERVSIDSLLIITTLLKSLFFKSNLLFI